MVEWTLEDLHRLVGEVEDVIQFANMGSRHAYKAIQSLKPMIDTSLERWTNQAKENKGPAK